MIAQAMTAASGPSGHLGALVDSAPMEKLARLGYVFAFLFFGVVLVSLYAAVRAAIENGHWVAFVSAIGMGAVMVWIFFKVGMVPDRRYTAWVRNLITSMNARYFFSLLLVLWVAGMGFLALQNLPATVVGGLALIGLFVGIFIFMGFIWSVIGE
jgi:hypothetical protein